jgi:nitrate reductase alpha subunit
MSRAGLAPALEGRFRVALTDGRTVECATLWTLYQEHLEDYDLETVAEITGAPKALIEQLADDLATLKPAAIHQGEGINHWFHATEANRAAYLPLMLTGNIGKPGAGCHTWAGNYKSALFQGSAATGPGFKGWVAEDPFSLNLDDASGRTSWRTPTRRTRSRPSGTTAIRRSWSTRPSTAGATSRAPRTCPRPPRR